MDYWTIYSNKQIKGFVYMRQIEVSVTYTM